MSCYSTKRKKQGVKWEFVTYRSIIRPANRSVELPSRFIKKRIFLDKPCNCAYSRGINGNIIPPYEKRITRILFSIYSQRT